MSTAESQFTLSQRGLPGSLRLLIDPPAGGAANMAVDEAMLTVVGAGEAPPTLRLYRWAEPTLSLGYFQSYAEVARQAAEVRSLPRVRRATGGGAILHADELTYALVLGLNRDGSAEPSAGLYDDMHAAITAAVERLAGVGGVVAPAGRDGAKGERASAGGRHGPFFCFGRRSRYDLLTPSGKLAGSAQRRTRSGVLQHGSVILRRTFPAQPSSSLAEIIGREVGFDELAEAVASVLRDAGAKLDPGRLTAAEREAVPALQAKHESDEWLHRR